jgi:hypothetical protein
MEEERQSFISSREAFVRHLCFWQIMLILPWLMWMLWTTRLATHSDGLGPFYYWVLLPGLLYVAAIISIARYLQHKAGILCPVCATRLGSQHPFEQVIMTGKCPQCGQDLFVKPAQATAGYRTHGVFE